MPKAAKIRFKINDNVVYPLHGVGVVAGIYEKEVNDKPLKFYKVKMEESGMTISVPYDSAQSLGLRKVISKDDIVSILRKLSIYPKSIEDNWKLRYQENIEKLKSGTIQNIATVVKELFLRNKIKNLSIMERKQYENAYRMMVKEISISGKTDEQEVNNLISSKLDSLAKKLEKRLESDA